MLLDNLLSAFLLFILIPIWLIAGFFDWISHRRTDISHTSGLAESRLHILMLGEVGLPILAGLFLDINAGVLAFMAFCLIAHEATAWWDLHYSSPRREIPPFEQMVHSFQEVIPLAAFACVAMLHWNQFAALLMLSADARFALEGKRDALPASYLVAVLIATFAFVILPFAEEFLRCRRDSGKTRDGTSA